MLQRNLVLIFRSFLRHKTNSLINLAGLSSALACILLINLWVNDELGIDKFHKYDDQLYLVMETGKESGVAGQTSGPVAEVLADEMPEVKYSVAVAPPTWPGFDSFILSVNDHTVTATGQFVGQDYFNMFSYPLVSGQPDQVLADNNSIVISEDLALRLFKTTQDVLGKTIIFQQEQQFKVSGIFNNITPASSMQFDFVMSFEKCAEIKPWVLDWNSIGPQVFVQLREGTNTEDFNQKIAGIVQDKTQGKFKNRYLSVVKYSDHYLYGNYENGVQSGGRIEYVRLFSIIAVIILVIACINFVNLSTAEATFRLKAVGIRKTLGAGRSSVAALYFGESLVMVMVSLVVATLLAAAMLPTFNLITGKHLAMVPDLKILIALLAITIITMLLAGGYPALYLSGFNPITVLKGKLNASMGGSGLRRGLVVFQFMLSIILITSVVVVYQQIDYIQNKHLGYNKDNVIYFEVEGTVKQNPKLFLSEIKKLPGILNGTSSTHDMVGHGWAVGLDWEGRDPDDQTRFQLMGVNHDFLETMDIELKNGRFFSKDFSNDTVRTVINEAAVEAIGFEDPIGRKLGGREIVGVVKNFHFMSFHDSIEPQVFALHDRYTQPTLIMLRIEAGTEAETIEQLRVFYTTFNPGYPLDYTFLDQEFQLQYAAEQQISVLSKYFAGLAIVISCLGLFGLAAFTIQKRFKEIGIRKILGSSSVGIVRLLSSEFTRVVLIAIGLALPVAYWLTKRWLDEYAYRIELQWWYFALAGLAGLLIAWITIGIHTFKASRINPVECLKEE